MAIEGLLSGQNESITSRTWVELLTFQKCEFIKVLVQFNTRFLCPNSQPPSCRGVVPLTNNHEHPGRKQHKSGLLSCGKQSAKLQAFKGFCICAASVEITDGLS